MTTTEKFGFAPMGIGTLLHQGKLSVPANQRPYAWRDSEAEGLFVDLNEAIGSDATDYFLGTIVLIQGDRDGVPSIADGQQRLATTTILLARIRDKLIALNDEGRARSIDTKFLREVDLDSGETVSRLTLNVEDNEFFAKHILPAPGEQTSSIPASNLRPSNKRLQKTSEIAADFIDKILSALRADAQSALLLRWVKFIEKSISVVVVTVFDEIGAYRIFEHLTTGAFAPVKRIF